MDLSKCVECYSTNAIDTYRSGLCLLVFID